MVRIEIGTSKDIYLVELLPKNSKAQSVQIITLVACWDGHLSEQEIGSLLRKIELMSGLTNGEWDPSMHRQLTNAFCETLEFAPQLSGGEMKEFIKKAASRITDESLRKATLNLAFQVASADSLDEDEARLLFEFGQEYWDMSPDDIREAVE